MYHFVFEASFFKLLTRPVPRLSPQEHAAFRRASPPSTSPPLSPLPLSWKAFTRVHWAPWAPWQTVGPSRGERGFSEDLAPYALDPYASARDRGDGWESGPKPFIAEPFLSLLFLFASSIFFMVKMCNTLSFFSSNFFHSNWKNCTDHFPILLRSRRGCK